MAKKALFERISAEELEFLDHSNRIEREYGPEALEDAVKAWEYAKKRKEKITLAYILKIHEILLKRLRPDIAGKVRKCAVMIGGEVKERKTKKELEDELGYWVAYTDFSRGDEEHVRARHVAFEKIHPFEDGNGRTGRILMNVHLLKAGRPIKIIHEGVEQMAYYGWFRA